MGACSAHPPGPAQIPSTPWVPVHPAAAAGARGDVASAPARASRTGSTLQEATEGRQRSWRAGDRRARVLYPHDVKAIPKGPLNESTLPAVVHNPIAVP